MITFGDASPPLAPAIAHALAELVPRVDVLSIPGATHAMLNSHPRDVARLIGHFCRSQVPAS